MGVGSGMGELGGEVKVYRKKGEVWMFHVCILWVSLCCCNRSCQGILGFGIL